MAEFSGPFDGSPITTQLQWSRMARRWGLDGVHALDASSTALKVSGSGTTTVTVAPGPAFVNGFYYHNDAAKNLPVTANPGGAARIDYVVLRASMSTKKVTAEYKPGGTTAPTLTQDEAGAWEIPLAQCTVAAGASTVTAANVLDRRWLTDRGVLPSIAGARPPASKGQLLLEDGRLYVGDGATWRWMASQGIDDSTYTPTWSAGTTTVNWGSNSFNLGRYQARGKRVDLTIQLQPSGNPPAYDDPLMVSLPPGLPATTAHRSLFTWNYSSGNGEGSAVGIGMIFPTEYTNKIARLRYSMTSGTTSTVAPNSFSLFTNQPFNIRSGDVLTIDGSYWTD
ncbi:hypothetical protein [Streptomyces prasinus]|uniref:hypothetical protein n=1 Tax=Streptomyces prasinus TaxID=67345 RepID=UPI0033A01ED2